MLPLQRMHSKIVRSIHNMRLVLASHSRGIMQTKIPNRNVFGTSLPDHLKGLKSPCYVPQPSHRDASLSITIPYEQKRIHVWRCAGRHSFRYTYDVHDDHDTSERWFPDWRSYCKSVKIFLLVMLPRNYGDSITDALLSLYQTH